MSKVADQLRLLAPCINRNIVECKSGIYIDVPRGCCVLIETLWNVNTGYTAYIKDGEMY